MPNVKLSDNFGLTIDAKPDASSSFVKYFKSLAKLKFSEFNANELKITELRDLPVKAFSTGVSFEEPVDIGSDRTALKVRAGVLASIECRLGSKEKKTNLFDSDLFGDPIEIPEEDAYLSLGITASVGAAAAGVDNGLLFGVEAGREITLTHYQRLPATGISFGQALERMLQGYVIPLDLKDFSAMAEGSVATVEGSGTLSFAGSVSLLSNANPLYDASFPAGVGKIALAAGASINIGASYRLSGNYQIRVQKVSATRYRFGFYRNRSSELAISVAAKAGITMKVGSSDLIATLLKTVSPNPELDRKELESVGLNEGQVAALEGAIKSGIERSLALAVGVELGAASGNPAAFLYDIDTAKIDDRGKEALQRALKGDLEGLTENEESPPQGISIVKSIFTSIKERKHTFKINLLGIYNFVSITKLIRRSVVLHDPLTGELTISDSATAERFRASTLNFAAKTEKLREVLAEQFLMTTLYRSTGLVASPPSLRSTHSYFERHSRTNRQTMKDNLDAAEAIKLLSAAQKAATLDQLDDFGTSVILLDAAYDDVVARSLFLKADGKPRPEGDYDRAGRQALERLVHAGEADDYRRRPALDDAVWEKMEILGQPGFSQLFPSLSRLQLEVVRSDYTVIKWWSQAMHRMAVELEKVDAFIREHPQADLEGQEFSPLRERLRKSLESVAKNVKAQFGDPWGVVAMDIASNHKAEARFRLVCPLVSLNLSRGGGPQA
jgi:hypothetical protein